MRDALRVCVAPRLAVRALHASAAAAAKPRRERANHPYSLRELKRFQFDDVPTPAHQLIQKQRQLLGYYRLLRHELPLLERACRARLL